LKQVAISQKKKNSITTSAVVEVFSHKQWEKEGTNNPSSLDHPHQNHPDDCCLRSKIAKKET
jgi:hypothetical protein